MPFRIVRNNIVHMEVDAIVNAANSALRMGGGVCGAIFEAAGAEEMQAACDRIGHCPVGGAVITPGFRLPAKAVIHAVGPVWQSGGRGEDWLLRSCYTESLRLARAHGLRSVAFPLISSGIYGYPKDLALREALAAIQEFLLENEDMDVSLVVFDRLAFALSAKLDADVRSYIDEHYVLEAERLQAARPRPQQTGFFQKSKASAPRETAEETACAPGTMPETPPEAFSPCAVGGAQPAEPHTLFSPDVLKRLTRNLSETFSEAVLRIIDEKGIPKDSIVYRRANIDKSVFSKLRSNPHYAPSKSTALALAVALELNLDQTRDLLGRAGYALSPSSLSDVIVSYFIESKRFDLFEINAALFLYDQPCLGAKG